MQIVQVGSYVPRKCGIATYTRDLTEALIQEGEKVSVVAIENKRIPHPYTKPVSYILKQHLKEDYTRIAQKISKSTVDLVHIQHEFGLFGGIDGDFILELAGTLTKPVFVTLHTVLTTPSARQRFIIQELIRIARGVIVMEEIAKDRLIHTYNASAHDIAIIFHGVPDVDGIKKLYAKKCLNVTNTFVILASNLLSRNKGIEYAIAAMPKIVKAIPESRLLIVGETHPLVKQVEGESYRNELTSLVVKLKLDTVVTFRNEYVTLDQLRYLLAAADIYTTPYLDPQQITSGTLSYAIGAGKACVSTNYIYAQNMLAEGRGLLVPFRNAKAIADAIISLHHNKRKLVSIEKKAYEFGKHMRWPEVAKKHIHRYKQELTPFHPQKYNLREVLTRTINVTHLDYLTDHTGIGQHTFSAIPDTGMGYATDDNARALIIVGTLYKRRPSKKLLLYIKTYLTFLRYAQDKTGKFHTFLSPERKWMDRPAVTDAYGRSVWGLGQFLAQSPPEPYAESADAMFRFALRQIPGVVDVKNAAYTMQGLHYYIRTFAAKKDSAQEAAIALSRLARYLIEQYNHHKTSTWHWFEEKLTYDNFRVCLSLLATYQVTGEQEYRTIGLETLAFVTNANFDRNRGYFDFVGQDGWYPKNGKKALYDQQPIEAASAVETYCFAYKITKQYYYLELAVHALEWFFGNNRNEISLIDPLTHGVYDGLTRVGINQNQGAESIVSFLIALLTLQDFSKKIKY